MLRTLGLTCVLLLGVILPEAAAQCNNLPDGTTCSGIVDGEQYPDPDDCASYYECNNECAEHKLCQGNFLFDLEYGCFYPTDVECKDRPCDNTDHCVTTPPPASTTEDCGHPWEGDCNELGEGFYPDPYNCRKYWNCMGNLNVQHMICEDNLLFKPDRQWCDYPENVECEDRPVCDECDNGCVTKPPPTPDCGHVMDCTDMVDGYYPDPYNCRKYWHCYAGSGDHMTCKDNLLYDPVNTWCNYPDSVQCGDRPICGPCDEDCQTTTLPCDHQMDCSSMPDGWYPDTYNCRKYWHCENGQGQHYTCDDNLLFDSGHVWCDFPDRVDCHGRPVCDNCDSNCHN